MSLLDKASLVQIPSGYKATKLYSVVPDSGAGDFTFARSTTGSRVGSDGLIETGVAIDTPRLDYSGGATCPNLKLEPQRTNLQTYSEDLTNGAWITSNSSVVANQTTSPDGTTTADKVDYGAGSGFIRNGVTLGSATTFSIFIKFFDFQWIQIMTSGDANHYANFDIQNGVLGNVGSSTEAEIEDYGNGWYRIVAKFVSGTFAGQPRLYKITSGVRPWAGGDGDAGSYYMWGGQQEIGTFQTSYIPTLGASVTRNAEACYILNNTDVIGQEEGVVFIDFVFTGIIETYSIFKISQNGSSADRLQLYFANTQLYALSSSTSGGAFSQIIENPTTIGKRYKVAIQYKDLDFKVYLNGTQVYTNTTAYSPDGMNQVTFSFGGTGTQFGFYNDIKQVLLSKEILTDTELAALTTI